MNGTPVDNLALNSVLNIHSPTSYGPCNKNKTNVFTKLYVYLWGWELDDYEFPSRLKNAAPIYTDFVFENLKQKSKWTEVNTLRNAQLKNYNARVSRSLVLLHILNYIYLLTIYI